MTRRQSLPYLRTCARRGALHGFICMHLLIPDLLLPRDHVREVLAGLDLPGLTALLADARELERERDVPAFQRSQPATRWLLQAFGLPASTEHAAIAPALRAADGYAPTTQSWHLVQPCHLAVARDHVQLGLERLALEAAQAQSLLDSIRPLLDEDGISVEVAASGRWYWHAPMLDTLLCAEPARAIGRNVDLWLPDVAPQADPAPARKWRRLHNEVQMLWFNHPVNEAREARNEPVVNGLWLHGGGADLAPGPAGVHLAAQACAARDDQALLRGLALRADRPLVARDATNTAQPALILLDELAGPAARNDWSAWRDALLALEATWFAPLEASGKPITLTVCSDLHWSTRARRTGVRWQFWKRPSLVNALAA